MASVDEYLATLDPERRAMIDTLRDIVVAAAPALTERIKWNAPSFAVGNEDRITLGLERKGGVRAVLHRGAVARTSAISASTMSIASPDGRRRTAAWSPSTRSTRS